MLRPTTISQCGQNTVYTCIIFVMTIIFNSAVDVLLVTFVCFFAMQAALCNPPLEEGDQVLYICGKSVAEKTHEDIIKMIQASRDQDPR